MRVHEASVNNTSSGPFCSTCDSEWWGLPITHCSLLQEENVCVTLNLKLSQRPRWERRDKVTQCGHHHSEAQRKSFFLTSLMHRPSCWTHFWAVVWGWAFMGDQIRVTRHKTRHGERPLCNSIDECPTAPAPAATTRMEVCLRDYRW